MPLRLVGPSTHLSTQMHTKDQRDVVTEARETHGVIGCVGTRVRTSPERRNASRYGKLSTHMTSNDCQDRAQAIEPLHDKLSWSAGAWAS